MFLRRLGQEAFASGSQCASTSACPDIWELADGDFAIIGTDITSIAAANLPQTAGCGPHERIIRLPRELLLNAKRDIPDPV